MSCLLLLLLQIKLRLLFPSADVSQMISRRPTLLLDEEFDQVGEHSCASLHPTACADKVVLCVYSMVAQQ
jgi:hypothetical protein